MNNVNKTLYIPLYGKAYVSRKGIILHDSKAESIWEAEKIELKGKSKSKWLAQYMGMRSAVFDNWLKMQMESDADAIIVHIGCGMDSRICRVEANEHQWYDVDFPDVIVERKRYYEESYTYHMIESDARDNAWIVNLPKDKNAIVVMEGVSMYFQPTELKRLLQRLTEHFAQVHILMDCYTTFAAKASKYKNPINDVGVTKVYGIDEPKEMEEDTGLAFVKEHSMTPENLVNELQGMERCVFRKLYSGKIARKMYRLYEYEKENK